MSASDQSVVLASPIRLTAKRLRAVATLIDFAEANNVGDDPCATEMRKTLDEAIFVIDALIAEAKERRRR